jgi:hypothetical protein
MSNAKSVINPQKCHMLITTSMLTARITRHYVSDRVVFPQKRACHVKHIDYETIDDRLSHASRQHEATSQPQSSTVAWKKVLTHDAYADHTAAS